MPRRARGATLQGVTELVGWVSSAVLLLTLARQTRKQWRERTSAGVSRWLFVGQTTASLGFTLYSALIANWVFAVTNALILANALVGLVIDRLQRRRDREGTSPGVRGSARTA